jgi:hypothetical protein
VLWLQVPVPLQVPTLVCAPEAHDAVPHAVELLGYVQAVALMPLQLAPQVPLPAHAVREPCTAPVTVTHVPTEPEASHA